MPDKDTNNETEVEVVDGPEFRTFKLKEGARHTVIIRGEVHSLSGGDSVSLNEQQFGAFKDKLAPGSSWANAQSDVENVQTTPAPLGASKVGEQIEGQEPNVPSSSSVDTKPAPEATSTNVSAATPSAPAGADPKVIPASKVDEKPAATPEKK